MYEKQSLDLRERLDTILKQHEELSKELNRFRIEKET